MPGPAARMGDTTAHGGSIVVGFPMVLIGGMPAARLGDMHVCPMATPAPVPVPHVGGPIVGPGVPTVLIGGMPAATMGDMCTCVGPPDVIVMGAPTVMIGMAGAGAGSAGSAAPGAGAGAAASANVAQFDNSEPSTLEEHWVEFHFVDKAGLPVAGVPYVFTDPEKKESDGVLRLDGRIRRDAMKQGGTCEVVLQDVYGAKWSGSTEKTGTPVDLEARTEGFDDGTPAVVHIYKRDIAAADVVVKEIKTTVSGNSVKASWTPESPEETEVLVPPEGAMSADGAPVGYTGPDFYFEVTVGRCQTRSGMLRAEDFVEVEVVDEQGKAMANEEYILYLPNGEVRRGKLDGSGKLREEGVPPGPNKLRLPNLPDYEIDV